MMSRRLPKKSKRFREAREQGAHDKVIPTHGSGASDGENFLIEHGIERRPGTDRDGFWFGYGDTNFAGTLAGERLGGG